MKIHYIRHADFEGLGIIAQWAEQYGHSVSCTRIYLGETLPSLDEFDLLISLGGPQSPLHYDQFPYLLDERDLISQAIAVGKYVIGFCLGAQLIAEALGAKTEKSPHKEVGLWPIVLNEAAKADKVLQHFPEQFKVLHWHNDMPGFTSEMTLLASSAGCPRQVFSVGDKVYGFQCHFEPTLADIEVMCEEDPGMLTPSDYTQATELMVQEDIAKMNALTIMFFDLWLGEASV
jgi:GMP synthase (glutamine-hydrolysing)